ncbi:MAG: hypothetical protein KDK48_03245 [Chlamydiia bacterium]|nr:hypothetical protein [Chlamydiia bacterium]
MSEELYEAIEGQQAKTLALARRIVPHATADDILQPNDFPELENNPEFRYEEGVMHGLMAAEALFRRLASAEDFS